MSTPPSSPTRCISDPVSAPTTRKRPLSVSFADDRMDDTVKVPRLELTANALGDRIGAALKFKRASPPPSGSALAYALKSVPRRQLPAFIGQKPEDSPLSSQESSIGSSDLSILEAAQKYLEDRIVDEENKRNMRYEAYDKTPDGSQNSIEVKYSQDSQLSGKEPPSKEAVARAIANTLPEERCQQAFRFGNIDDMDVRVNIMLPYFDADLQIFLDFVNEAIDAARSSSSKPADSMRIGRTPS